jgi:adenylate cyclase
MPEPTQRRLAAIVAADVVGYSRMMHADELGTLRALRSCRSEIIDPHIDANGGRIVKTMGDGLLLEFPSVVAAAEFAVAVQRALIDRNSGVPADSAIRLRIGIHIGDVIIDGDDIFGDGVNIAARVEPLAKPDGVALSDDAYRQVRDRLHVRWQDDGVHNVKNIPEPLQLWQWHPESGTETDKPSAAAPAPPTLPSIAVLPFANMSGDPEQEYFADGMTEDLVTDLSKLSGLFVVARSSTATFGGPHVDVKEVARQLRVRYVLEGSVRKAGERVRINVKLTDVDHRELLWAERYDGTIDNVFELQDDVGAKVVSALSVRLQGDESDRLQRVHTHNLEAYELFVQAKATPYPPVPSRVAAAKEMFEQVIAMDPQFAGGYAGVAVMIGLSTLFGHGDVEQAGQAAASSAARAVEVDDSFGWGHAASSFAMLLLGRHDDAIDAANEAITRQPNDADAHAYLGLMLTVAGQPAAGVEPINQAIRLNPRFIGGPYLNLLSFTKFIDGDHRGAIDAFERNVEQGGPVGPPALAWAAAAYARLGDGDKAQTLAARALAQVPDFRLSTWNLLSVIRGDDLRTTAREAMEEAGFPD